MVSVLKQCRDSTTLDLPEIRANNLASWLKRLGASPTEIESVLTNLPNKGWKAVSVASQIDGKEPPHYRRILNFRNFIDQAVQAEEPQKIIAYLSNALRMVLRRRHKKLDLHLLIRDLAELEIQSRQFKHWKEIDLKLLDRNEPETGVFLGTMHGAKGREWKYVFVINCVEGIVPIHYAKTDDLVKTRHAVMSEKRLFYVACTRHKKGLYLLNSPTSLVGYKNKKRKDLKFKEPSVFIENHKKLLKYQEAAKRKVSTE